MMKNWIWIALVVGAIIGYQHWQQQTSGKTDALNHAAAPADTDAKLQAAFDGRQSNLQIRGRGVVSKTLPDDNKGSRHQRFILKLSSGQTLLVAHNIDLAPRIPQLKKGDAVAFYGEYEWSAQGGVIHWTHHDPKGRHADGWLEHRGIIYQ